MKQQVLHKIVVQHLVDALKSVFEKNEYADKVLEKLFKNNRQLGSRDRSFIAESFYDIIRYKRWLESVLLNSKNYWQLIAVFLISRNFELPNWQEFEHLKTDEIEKKLAESANVRAIRESIPDWLDDVGLNELGPIWEPELKALNQKASVVLRVNTLRMDKKTLKTSLDKMEIQTIESEDSPDALVLLEKKNVFNTDLFKNGYFELQDVSSQRVAHFVQANPGQIVVDACAGAGGKTLHMACLMQNKGRILALDTEEWKLQELKKRARRNGIQNIETRIIDSTKVIKRLHNSADRVLLDVPCSGLGVLRRNPDTKWKLSLESLELIKQTQSSILDQYCSMVKSGGKLIYVTCSILPSENQEQVKAFLLKHAEFKLEEEQILMPSICRFDGFYMARMIKA